MLEYAGQKHGLTYWLCKCSCEKGTIRKVRGTTLNKGKSFCCGCLNTSSKCDVDEISRYRKEFENKPFNEYDLSGQFGIGFTSKGDEFYFDIEDYDIIKGYGWTKDWSGYIKSKRNDKEIKLHRLLMNPKDDMSIDHINRIKHDNRKSNLREVSHSENSINTSLAINNTSGIIGVCYLDKYNLWEANLQNKGKRIRHNFKSKEDAIVQRLKWEIEYFGEFAPQKHLYSKYLPKEDVDNWILEKEKSALQKMKSIEE